MSFPNAVFSAVFVPSPPELKLISLCFLTGFPVEVWLLYALPSITYTGWRVSPFCPIWTDFRNHLIEIFWCSSVSVSHSRNSGYGALAGVPD